MDDRPPLSLKNLDWTPWPRPEEAASSVVWRAIHWLLREPALLVSVTYVSVGFLGLWSSYWFYSSFDLPVMQYLQISDFLVAGLRSPAYLALLAVGIVSAALISLPEMVELRHPEEIRLLRQRHWGWYLLFPLGRLRTWASLGLHPLTGVWVTLAIVLLMGSALSKISQANDIRRGLSFHPVHVHLTGDAEASKETAELLGTSSGFIYLWWPRRQQVDVVAVGAVRRLILPKRHAQTGSAAKKPARPEALSKKDSPRPPPAGE